MISRIYLFCNLQYGQSYLKVFKSFAHKHHNIECYAILSSKGSQKGRLHRVARSTKNLIKLALERKEINWLADSGIKLFEIDNINDSDFIAKIPPGSIGFIAGFNQILHKKIIDKFSLLINFHPSILPYYRGAIPSYWVIRNREKITGFTAHVVTETVDAGKAIYQEFVEVNSGISEQEIDAKIAAVGSYYFAECLDSVRLGKQLRHRCLSTPYVNKIDYVPKVRS